MTDILDVLLKTNTLWLVPPVLIVVNQVLIKQFNMPTKYAILVNWVLSIALMLCVTWGTIDPLKAILIGVLLGASSSGLYDVKKLFR